MTTLNLVCPYCDGDLVRRGGTLSCAKSHSFDLARQGYVSLNTGRHPGDTRKMLLARRAFLDAGHYLPLSLAINQRVADRLRRLAAGSIGHPRVTAILDAGCGEGYYLERLAEYLAECPDVTPGPVEIFGLDISRDGIRLATGRRFAAPAPFFIAADLKAGLPFPSASLQALLNVFAPRNAADFARVLTPGGLLLVVIPAPDHLIELRRRLPLLQIEDGKLERVLSQFSTGFSLGEKLDLSYQLLLNPAELDLLLTMTPTHRHADLAGSVAEPLAVTASFRLLSLVRL